MHKAFLFSTYEKIRKQYRYASQHTKKKKKKTLVIPFHYNIYILISKKQTQ